LNGTFDLPTNELNPMPRGPMPPGRPPPARPPPKPRIPKYEIGGRKPGLPM
jgi:hypothetical protein